MDYFKLSNYYSEEELMIANSVREFAKKELVSVIKIANEQGFFPKHIITQMAQLGLFGINLPEPYGLGLSKLAYGLVCQELEAVDSSFRSILSVQNSLVMFAIHKFGSPEQQEQLLPALAAANKLGCFALTEHDHGSDPNGMQTTAVAVKDTYLINGSKMWITNAPIADIIICFAKLDNNIRGFILDAKTPGVNINVVKHKLSLRASITGEIFLDNVVVPKENLLPGTDIGLSAALQCLTMARFGISFGAIGAANSCLQIALDYTKNRVQFNKKIASCQLVQQDLVNALDDIVKAQLLNIHVAKHSEATDWYIQVSLAKRNACRCAKSVASKMRSLLGGNGIMPEYHIMRHLMNMETLITYEGTDNIHTLILGQYLTGESAF